MKLDVRAEIEVDVFPARCYLEGCGYGWKKPAIGCYVDQAVKTRLVGKWGCTCAGGGITTLTVEYGPAYGYGYLPCLSALLLGGIAMTLKRRVNWDPVNEEFPGDDEANRLLSVAKRAPWRV